MDKPLYLYKYLLPLVIYVLVISLIFLMKRAMSWPYVISVSAVLMLSAPFILKTDMRDLRWDPKGVLTGIAVSVVILLLYVAILAGYGLYSGKSLTFEKLSYSFFLVQLLLVALPEEVFFRGYLQQQLGNTLKAVVAVSLLFALGHVVTLCLGGGSGLSVCSQAVLTFFPSLVMGYLYMATGTLWASVIFHFLANIVHITAGFS
jgi:membrane protease YdiL (CAAX protease family)